jgi:hypothetical protein
MAATERSGLHPSPLEQSEADRLPQFAGVSDSGNLLLPRNPNLSFLPRTPVSALPRTPISRTLVVRRCCQTPPKLLVP